MLPVELRTDADLTIYHIGYTAQSESIQHVERLIG